MTADSPSKPTRLPILFQIELNFDQRKTTRVSRNRQFAQQTAIRELLMIERIK